MEKIHFKRCKYLIIIIYVSDCGLVKSFLSILRKSEK